MDGSKVTHSCTEGELVEVDEEAESSDKDCLLQGGSGLGSRLVRKTMMKMLASTKPKTMPRSKYRNRMTMTIFVCEQIVFPF